MIKATFFKTLLCSLTTEAKIAKKSILVGPTIVQVRIIEIFCLDSSLFFFLPRQCHMFCPWPLKKQDGKNVKFLFGAYVIPDTWPVGQS